MTIEKAREAVWDMGLGLDSAICDSIAFAVLMAIREPSDLVRWAGSVQFERAKAEGFDAGEAAATMFSAMIDASLQETDDGE